MTTEPPTCIILDCDQAASSRTAARLCAHHLRQITAAFHDAAINTPDVLFNARIARDKGYRVGDFSRRTRRRAVNAFGGVK